MTFAPTIRTAELISLNVGARGIRVYENEPVIGEVRITTRIREHR
jgi:hypothetical protein